MSKVRHFKPRCPFLQIATRGGKSCYKFVRQPSKVISNASVVVCSIWLTLPLSFVAPVSKTMAVWHRH